MIVRLDTAESADLDELQGIDFADYSFLANSWLSIKGGSMLNPDCDILDPPDGVINMDNLKVFLITGFVANSKVFCNTDADI